MLIKPVLLTVLIEVELTPTLKAVASLDLLTKKANFSFYVNGKVFHTYQISAYNLSSATQQGLMVEIRAFCRAQRYAIGEACKNTD